MRSIILSLTKPASNALLCSIHSSTIHWFPCDHEKFPYIMHCKMPHWTPQHDNYILYCTKIKWVWGAVYRWRHSDFVFFFSKASGLASLQVASKLSILVKTRHDHRSGSMWFAVTHVWVSTEGSVNLTVIFGTAHFGRNSTSSSPYQPGLSR